VSGDSPLTNWGANYTYGARAVHRPTTIEQLQELVGAAPRLRVLGTRHAFTGMGDSAQLVTLERLPANVVIDRRARNVALNPALTYGELAGWLAGEGMALANLASLPHISVAGAVATATHGSGDQVGNLATAVCALELVKGDGELVRVARGELDFNGVVVGLGALGAVTRITLDIEPAYEVRQRVFEGLEWEALYEHFDAIMASGYSVSAFTRWGERVEQVWIKSRVTDEPEQLRDTLFGARPATLERHPILGSDPVNCTSQLGVPGPWSQRLPHFRMGFTPSSGEEIQSEYLLPRRHAVAAISAVRELAQSIAPLVLVAEIRTVASDELWMSPEYGRDTVGIHFTWRRAQRAVERALADVESALAPFQARPHWGKLFLGSAAAIAPRYERVSDFSALVARWDPRGTFRNHWLETHVLKGA
jgi:xylitol oxidase